MVNAENSEYEKVPTVEFSDHNVKTKETPSYGYGIRHVQSFIIFLSLLMGYIARAHLGVSVVAMTYAPTLVHDSNHTTTNVTEYIERFNQEPIEIAANATENLVSRLVIDDKLNTTLEELQNNDTLKVNASDTDNVFNVNLTLQENEWDNYSMGLENITSDENGIYKKYSWTKPIQEMVLTSFYLGYCVMQYLMSMIAQRYGGKLPLQIGLLINGVVSIATPWLASLGGWQAVCVCRILQGASQGGFYPSIQTLLAQWVPPNERARIASFIYTAANLGTIIAFQLSGVLAASTWGWPSIFWSTGTLCCLAFLILTVFGAATPAEHKSITEEELRYITFTMTNVNKKKPQVPLKAVLSSKHIWATFATHTGSMVAFLFNFMQVPSYIHYSLGVNVKDSGLFSSLPYVASVFTAVLVGILSDYLTNRNIISVKTARRTFNSLSQVGMAVCFIAVPYTKNVSLAIALLVILQCASVGFHVGWMVNYIDLSSNFSGAILAMGNTINNFFTLSLPILVSYIVTDVTNQSQWRVMFYLMAVVAFLTNAIFVVFMSAERQPWDYVENEKRECEDNALEEAKKDLK